MAELKIEIRFMALAYSNSGLTVLLPSAGHDASLSFGNLSTPLAGSEVTLMRDGTATTGTKKVVSRTADRPGLLLLQRVMEIANEPSQGMATPRSELLSHVVHACPELNARIVLPDGNLSGDPKARTEAALYEFRNDRGDKTDMSLASMFYTVQLDGAKHVLQVKSASDMVQIDVTKGGLVVIANADRPTRNKKGDDWHEFKYLLDLLALKEMRYIYPKLKEGLTPFVEPCGGVVAGSLAKS